MSAMASLITSLTIVYSTVYWDADQKKNKAPRHWPLCGEFTGHRWIPAQRASNPENVSIWWRHHVLYELQPRKRHRVNSMQGRICTVVKSDITTLNIPLKLLLPDMCTGIWYTKAVVSCKYSCQATILPFIFFTEKSINLLASQCVKTEVTGFRYVSYVLRLSSLQSCYIYLFSFTCWK